MGKRLLLCNKQTFTQYSFEFLLRNVGMSAHMKIGIFDEGKQNYAFIL